MNKILIVGKNSYIGTSFFKLHDSKNEIHFADSRNDNWKSVDFSEFTTILHCAGIAHQKRVSRALYDSVNRDLAVAVAKKASASGVKQFIFLSSVAANENAKDFYGASKFEAEKQLLDLETEDFKICIVRPPMVYGAGCKGNFPRLVRLAKLLPVFPEIPNKRSMIYIENLCEFLSILIHETRNGIHLPQNKDWVNTTELVTLIRHFHGKKTFTTRIFNAPIIFLAKRIPTLNKIFGDLAYPHCGDEISYNKVSFTEGVKNSLMD